MNLNHLLTLASGTLVLATGAALAQTSTTTPGRAIAGSSSGGGFISTQGSVAVSLAGGGRNVSTATVADPLAGSPVIAAVNVAEFAQPDDGTAPQPEVSPGSPRAVAGRTRAALSGMSAGGYGGGAGAFSVAGLPGRSSPEPAIITSSGLESEVRSDWQEDLRVMDKLLRDEVSRVEGDSPRLAMGIRVLLSEPASQSPLYLDGYGALFTYRTEVVLAGSGKKSEPGEARKTSSTWENARRQLSAPGQADGTARVWTYAAQHGLAAEPQLAREFDAARLDKLVDAVIGVLAEARNIRHFRAGDCVTVSLAGTDEAGNGLRLTLKATKGDVAQLAEGKLTPEEFKRKVARHLG